MVFESKNIEFGNFRFKKLDSFTVNKDPTADNELPN